MTTLVSSQVKIEWQPYVDFLRLCLSKWHKRGVYINDLIFKLTGEKAIARRVQEDEESSDKDFLKPDTDVAEALEGVEIIEALKDLKWMDVILIDA